MWLSIRVKLPILVPLSEVDLLISAPDKGGVHIVGDTGETFLY